MIAEELSGIFNLTLAGCLAWKENGLGSADQVKKATAGYSAEMDVIGGFIEACCVIGQGEQVTVAAIHETYVRWCDGEREKALGKRAFRTCLEERGFEPDRGTGGVRLWKGIGLVGVT